MTKTNEDLLLDPDGIPILTDLVADDATPNADAESRKPGSNDVSVEELARLLLNSNAFKKQLDVIAAELTRSVRQQLELALRPTLEEAITVAFDDSNAASCEAVRKQLEADLPELLARAVQE
ncbi:MAG: hypothetical protein LJE75_02045 [Gammaproteobacteria bacterium]|jgi:hypothetical protein|nr:hypothetical protein [Gammaproteobacteria bacterium]